MMYTRFEVRITANVGDPEYEQETTLSGEIGEAWWEAAEDIVRLIDGAFVAAYGYRPPVGFAVKDLEENEI